MMNAINVLHEVCLGNAKNDVTWILNREFFQEVGDEYISIFFDADSRHGFVIKKIQHAVIIEFSEDNTWMHVIFVDSMSDVDAIQDSIVNGEEIDEKFKKLERTVEAADITKGLVRFFDTTLTCEIFGRMVWGIDDNSLRNEDYFRGIFMDSHPELEEDFSGVHFSKKFFENPKDVYRIERVDENGVVIKRLYGKAVRYVSKSLFSEPREEIVFSVSKNPDNIGGGDDTRQILPISLAAVMKGRTRIVKLDLIQEAKMEFVKGGGDSKKDDADITEKYEVTRVFKDTMVEYIDYLLRNKDASYKVVSRCSGAILAHDLSFDEVLLCNVDSIPHVIFTGMDGKTKHSYALNQFVKCKDAELGELDPVLYLYVVKRVL